MLAAAPAPEDARGRLFIDRVFTIKGAGTVVTGTLTGEALSVGEDVELFPTGTRARIRSLQTHKRAEDHAEPVSRVAANLVGAERETLERGDVLGRPGAWRATETIEASLHPVRGLAHPITGRGAFKLYEGAAEADAKLRLLGRSSLEPGEEAFVRIRLARPLILDVFDRFVVREAGRRETVAGGIVLDVAPPVRPGPDAIDRLVRRATSSREELPTLLALERGAVGAAEAELLTGARVAGPLVGGWLVRPGVRETVTEALAASLRVHHADHPLEEGAPLAGTRRAVAQALRREGAPADPDLIEALIDADVADGTVVRTASALRLTSHVVALDTRSADIERLLAAVGGEHEAAPSTVRDLQAQGIGRDVLEAAAREGLVIRVSPELVFAPDVIARAEAVVRAAGPSGITVSAFREALGTSRKYAVPRVGVVRHARGHPQGRRPAVPAGLVIRRGRPRR